MSFSRKLSGYVDSWTEKKIITAKQRTQILEDFHSESATSNLFKIIAVIGSLFIGVGILLLISSNWEYLPKVIKLLFIIAMPTVSLGLGYYLSYVKTDYKKIGDALIILGALLIGGALALFTQLYQIDVESSVLLLIWSGLTIPLTILFRYQVLSFLTIVLFYIGMTMQYFHWSFQEETAILFFAALSAVLVVVTHFIRKGIEQSYTNIFEVFEVVSLKVLFISLFTAILYDGFYFFGESLFSGIVQNLLFIVVIFSVMWAANKSYNTLLRNSTFFWLGAFMVAKYFDWFWDMMDVGLFFVIFGAFLILLVFGYIKGTKYLESVKEDARASVQNEQN